MQTLYPLSHFEIIILFKHIKSFIIIIIIIVITIIIIIIIIVVVIIITGIHSMQDWIATTRHGVTRKIRTKILTHIGNLLRKNLQLNGVC